MLQNFGEPRGLPKSVFLKDQFGQTTRTKITLQYLCAPLSRKGDEILKEGETHLTCYTTTGRPVDISKKYSVTDQFVTNRIVTVNPQPVTFCLPALKRPVDLAPKG
jgi:hypothetical protein